jgi:Ca2+-binding RTX toxin-like protein
MLVTRRLLFLSFLAISALVVFAPTASASTAAVFGTNFTYTADPGEANNVQLAFNSGTGEVTLTDSTATLTDPDNSNADPGVSCTLDTVPNPDQIVCTGVTSGSFYLDDMNDVLNAAAIPSPGSIEAYGGTGNDTLTGSGGSDYLDGEAGTDNLSGGGGDDELDDTSDAGDHLDGGAGDDYFYLGSAPDGNDTDVGGLGSDSLDYSSRNAAITADLAAKTESSTGENDSIDGFENVYGAYSVLGANHLTGDDQPNDLEGGQGADVIHGAGGDDGLYAYGGNDQLYGDDGNDVLRAYDGQDTLGGGAGDDYLDPGDHYDSGLDDFVSDGSDTVDGGDGSDTIEYGNRDHALTVNLTGATTGNGESGEDDHLSNLENINGGYGGHSTYTGNDSSNTIYAFGGPGDTLNGLGGDDDLEMDDGDVDTANCGGGNDLVWADRVAYGYPVDDNVASDCETIDGVPVSSSGAGTTGTTTGTTGTTTTPPPVVTPPQVVTPAAPVFANAAFLSKTQQSPKADTITGSFTVASDGSNFEADALYNGKLAKVTIVGKSVKKGLKTGSYAFKIKLNKKAAKLARKKGKKGLKLTVKITIKPPTGSAVVKTYKVTVRKGKAPACYRAASVRAHAAC